MKENPIENRLRERTKLLGCECWKFTSPGRRGMPDDIVICPGRRLEFVETKATGETPTPLQRFVHKLLAKLGFKVWLIDSYEKVDAFCEHLKNQTL